MRVYSKALFASFCAVATMSGCSERDLRPLTPCTTLSAQASVNINEIKNVDLLFMVDDSNSMETEQRKLRDEFPRMINALVTGDIDGDSMPDGPAVASLRVAVVTSDMGVRGMGTQVGESGIASCGRISGASTDPERANYGDDGRMVTQTSTVYASQSNPNSPVIYDCDSDNTGGDDVVADLPGFLTFPESVMNLATDQARRDEFERRVSCIANTGVEGCGFEQQLEAVLKAVTPAGAETAALVGGRFYVAPGSPDSRGEGHAGTGVNGSWFRDEATTLLAVVLVTDEDDCSASERQIFRPDSTAPGFTDQYPGAQSKTRCARYEETGQYPIQRYVDGLVRRRAENKSLLVFAAITGVPPELTDEGTEGSSNLTEILAHPRMQYNYETNPVVIGGTTTDVPAEDLTPACVFRPASAEFNGTADFASGSRTLTVTVPPVGGLTSFTLTGTLNSIGGVNNDNIVVLKGSPNTPLPGMSVSGAGIPAGTVIVDVLNSASAYQLNLSADVTAGAGVTITLNESRGPAKDMLITGTGLPDFTEVDAVTGTGPYTVTISRATSAVGAGAAVVLGTPDVKAAVGRRIVRVAEGIALAQDITDNANTIVQSICVPSFAPAMERILRTIQSNLGGACLPRSQVRNATNQVNCDVFVTMPPNTACDTKPGYTFLDTVSVPATRGDSNNELERCVVTQLPVTSADRTTVNEPSGDGWYYDDYTSAATGECPASRPQRISFAGTADPPNGAKMDLGCAQPVPDGDLQIDISSACDRATSTVCTFTGDGAGEFKLRYNLPDSFDPATDMICEFDSNTCQIACERDADCPGGFVCYDDPFDAETSEFCVNPTCGNE